MNLLSKLIMLSILLVHASCNPTGTDTTMSHFTSSANNQIKRAYVRQVTPSRRIKGRVIFNRIPILLESEGQVYAKNYSLAVFISNTGKNKDKVIYKRPKIYFRSEEENTFSFDFQLDIIRNLKYLSTLKTLFLVTKR